MWNTQVCTMSAQNKGYFFCNFLEEVSTVVWTNSYYIEVSVDVETSLTLWIDFLGWLNWNLFFNGLFFWDLVLSALYHHCIWAYFITVITMPLGSAVCQDSCMKCVKGDCLGDSLVTCICGMKGITGEASSFILFYYLWRWFLMWNGFYQ